MSMTEFEQQVLTDLSDIKSRLTALETRKEICELHQNETKAIQKDLDGNGKPGLKKIVSDLITEWKVYKAKVATWAAAGSFVGGGVMFAIANWDKIKDAFTR